METLWAALTVLLATTLISPAQNKGIQEHLFRGFSTFSGAGERWTTAPEKQEGGKAGNLKSTQRDIVPHPTAKEPLVSQNDGERNAGNLLNTRVPTFAGSRGSVEEEISQNGTGYEPLGETPTTLRDNGLKVDSKLGFGGNSRRIVLGGNGDPHRRLAPGGESRDAARSERGGGGGFEVEDSRGVADGLAQRREHPVGAMGRRRRSVRRTHPLTPCPGVFLYLGGGPREDRWLGNVTLTTDEKVVGVKLGIQLDKPALSLGSWLGGVDTEDNMHFTIQERGKIIQANSPFQTKIVVKFTKGVQPPRITTITLNGNQICPPVPCGQIEDKPRLLIAKGEPTEKGDWPWHAAIYLSTGYDSTYICGGTVIGKQTILTAAHCVTESSGRNIKPFSPDSLVVFLGKFHLRKKEDDVQKKKVKHVNVHPEFNRIEYVADIAILELSTPIDFDDYVKPACLWNENRPHLSEIEGQDGVVVGWGYDENGVLTEDLKMANMPVVSQQKCILSNQQFFARYTSDRTFCAGYRNGTSACNGDSGGGMFFPKKVPGKKDELLAPLTWTVRGIVSFSPRRGYEKICDTKQYVVFVDAAKYSYWIRNYL